MFLLSLSVVAFTAQAKEEKPQEKMSLGTVIGIDFGTTYSHVAFPGINIIEFESGSKHPMISDRFSVFVHFSIRR
jgi:hypothetical protein